MTSPTAPPITVMSLVAPTEPGRIVINSHLAGHAVITPEDWELIVAAVSSVIRDDAPAPDEADKARLRECVLQAIESVEEQ